MTPELLSPAGSPEALRAAVQNGAGAVYLGWGGFNARRNAKNFSEEEFADALKSLDGLEEIVEKPLFAEDGVYQGQPILLTEFGGISISDSAGEWGYTSVNKEEFIEEFRRIIEAVADSPVICGYCYTQLTDVEQEANGLLTQEHNHKFSPDKIREIQNIAGR